MSPSIQGLVDPLTVAVEPEPLPAIPAARVAVRQLCPRGCRGTAFKSPDLWEHATKSIASPVQPNHRSACANLKLRGEPMHLRRDRRVIGAGAHINGGPRQRGEAHAPGPWHVERGVELRGLHSGDLEAARNQEITQERPSVALLDASEEHALVLSRVGVGTEPISEGLQHVGIVPAMGHGCLGLGGGEHAELEGGFVDAGGAFAE